MFARIKNFKTELTLRYLESFAPHLLTVRHVFQTPVANIILLLSIKVTKDAKEATSPPIFYLNISTKYIPHKNVMRHVVHMEIFVNNSKFMKIEVVVKFLSRAVR